MGTRNLSNTAVRIGVVAVLCVLTTALSQRAAVEPPNPTDLTQGIWVLNVAESKFCGPARQSSSRVIIDAGWGLIATTMNTVRADGSATESRYVLRYDGQKYPSTIDQPANESISWELVDPHRVEFIHWSKENEITSEYVRTVSEDGQRMTQSAKFVVGAGDSRDGCAESQVFSRVESLPRP